jgi:hypothetical protein
MRRMWHDAEFPEEVFFEGTDPSIRDPRKPVVGALLVASGDGISRRADRMLMKADFRLKAQWASTFESSRANKFCPLCDVYKSDKKRYHDWLRYPGDSWVCLNALFSPRGSGLVPSEASK